ncbi:hypothetical protein SJAG_00398 [Schizosaccharomyces japonicus yFS275]|uniref:Uncharacterized protein n=1 Tax=Schizosaccharomyces japonicus (strain yFS275 / FY16936) TaxID=402676 RepID=B6JVI7_SCHJY|nr:hypothetical protein SJAG_00398 [Schizosaccharomyces japonicus yFS275]EEB05388.1 hypothetical protein SJAG_00398 [Schizosaccharomyces japonicus yFS275]
MSFYRLAVQVSRQSIISSSALARTSSSRALLHAAHTASSYTASRSFTGAATRLQSMNRRVYIMEDQYADAVREATQKLGVNSTFVGSESEQFRNLEKRELRNNLDSPTWGCEQNRSPLRAAQDA